MTTRNDSAVRRATVWYGRLLRLLPSWRRDGDAMLALFGRLAREAHRRDGGGALFRVLLLCAFDVLGVALRTRVSKLLRRREAGAYGDGPSSPGDRTPEFPPRGRGSSLESLVLDVRYGLRSLRRRPGLAFLACATFALGIGATAAIFGVVDAVLLRPLPYGEPERLVRLLGHERGELNRVGTLAYLNAMDVGAMSATLDGVAAFDEWRPNLTGAGEPELVSAGLVNANFFDVLGVTPAAGRFFVPEEDVDGRDRVVVLSHSLWQRLFAGDESAVGSTVVLNGTPHTIVGIAPESFEDPKLSGPRWGDPQLWRPLGFGGMPLDQQPSRGSSSYTAIARLAPGATLEAAVAELRVLSTRLERDHPDQNTGVGMTAVTLRDSIVGDVRSSLLLLFAAVGVLLAIAAANVGSLLLGRAAERRREVAMRIALGASRARVSRQIVVETIVLAVVGGAAGVAAALFATKGMVALGEEFVPRGTNVTVSPMVLGFALGVTLATGLICGLVPALSVGAADPGRSLRDGDRASTGGKRALRLRAGLIGAEVSLALLLLIGAGLLSKSLWRLMNVDVGIEAADLLTFDLAPPTSSYPGAANVDVFYDELLTRLEALPGVETVAAVNIAPLTGGFDSNSVSPSDRPMPPPGERESAEVRTVTPEYFDAVSLALRRGRLIEPRDRAGVPNVAVISETMAARTWPGEDPIGKRFATIDTVVEVVGVVADVKHMRLEEPAPPMFYVARAQAVVPWQTRRMTIVVRARDDAASLAHAVRAEVRALDAQLPIANLRTMRQIIARSAAPPRFRTLLLGSFAALALLLATLGIYGVVSYSVAQRSREMAIRMALGARADAVRRLVLRQGLAPVALGLAVGLLAALGLAQLLAAVLFEVPALDASVFLGVPAVMLGIAAAASVAPARRATRVDPMTVLREE